MKKLITLTKTLLVLAGLCVGVNAWGQISEWTATSGTYTKGQEIKGNTEGVIVMTLGEDDGWTYDSGRKAIVARTQQTPTLSGNIPTAGGYVVITPVKKLQLSLTTYSSQSNCNVYMYDANGTKLKDFRQKAYNTNDFGTLEAGKNYYIYGGGFKAAGNETNLEYVFFQKFTATSFEDYTIHYVDNHGTTIKDDAVRSALYGSKVTASAEDMTSIEFNNKTYAYTSGNKIITLGTGTNEITLVFETAEVCNYTIKYFNDSDPAVEIKDAAIIESYVGAEVTADGDNLPQYIVYDEVKYKYLSGNTNLTVTGNSETDVITLVYTPADIYNYTLNASDGTNIIKQLASGSFVEGDDNPIVYFPKAFIQDDVLYETAETTFKKVFTGSEVASVVYTISQCDYIYDETELNKTRSYAASYQKDFMSNGYGARIYTNATVYTPALSGGLYTVVINAGTYNKEPTLKYGIRINDTNIKLGETNPWSNGSYGAQQTITNIPIPDGASFCFIGEESGNSNVILDYIKLTKTADYPSLTIGASGYATFSNANYAFDFTNTDVKAYTASLNSDNTVLLTPVKQVPANTGLVLAGAQGTYDIPVITEAAAITGNLLKPSADEEITASTDDLHHYVLAKRNDNVGFYNLATAKNIGAGKAYLETTVALATNADSRVAWIFADGTTGIKTTNLTNDTNETIYNLNGQRVAAPQKGLYIVNGKKVIMK